MPLPVLFVGAAVLAGAAKGAKDTTRAVVDNYHARAINEDANKTVDLAKENVEKNRKITVDVLNTVGEEKISILNGSINDFLEAFTKIKNVDFAESEGLSELGKVKIDKASFQRLGEMRNFAAGIASGLISGTAGGALAAIGAYGAAGAFASASTGTAIAALHGAAASNATLAFFGGGSLAAGGFGMAGGTIILGGLVAAPALLVLGHVAGSHAAKNLEQAYINQAEAAEIVAQLDTVADKCYMVSRRANMIYNLLARLDAIFLPLVLQLQNVIEAEGVDYKLYSSDSKAIVASAASVAVTIKTVLDTPMLTDEGNLTDESAKLSGLERQLLRA